MLLPFRRKFMQPGNLSPASVGGLVLWVHPGTIQVSGSDATGWNDASGNGNHLAPTSGNPLYVASAINGLPGIQVDSGENMKRASFVGGIVSQSFTIYSVTIFTTTDSTHAHNAGTGSTVQCQRQGTNIRFTAGTQILVPGPTPGTALITEMVVNGASSSATGIYSGAAVQTVSGNLGSSSLDGFSVGTTVSGAGNYYRSPECEFAVYDGIPTDDERSRILSGFQRKYNVNPI